MSSGVLGLPVVDDQLERRLRRRLEQVEQGLAEATRSDNSFVTEIAGHLLAAGGKRFRPMLTLLGAEFGDPRAVGVVPAAVVVELTHLATLYHDDVMDAAHLRRGGQTANARWGNSAAILTGDYLFARASDIVADLGPECVRIQARTFSRLVQGQLSETVGPGECEPVSHYLAVVADKTGSLIATSVQLGARMSGAGEKAERLLAEFGERIGVAFQLSDDVLDVASDTSQSGKVPGTDLRAGVPTLPVLLALRADDAAADTLRRLLDSDLSDDDVLAEALQVLRRSPAMATARREVAERAETARRLLDPLPDVPARSALAALCDLVVSRTG